MRFHANAKIFTAELTALLLSGAVFSAQSQSADPSDGLFQRVQARMAGHLERLPNYTCHQTTERMIRVGSDFRHLDTVDLEVAFVGKQELFSRTGEDKFGEQRIESLVPGGTIGNGALGSHIDKILKLDVAEFKYAGACKKDGRKTFRFDLLVPIERSALVVRHDGRAGVAGYEGSFWVDAETLDPVRVDFKVNKIPSYLGVRLIEESLHYKKLTIGNSEFDLPDHSVLAAMDSTGQYTLNTIKLTGCREFSADSVVKYGSPTQGTADRDRQEH
jgi:hypothetical protein